jgi:hypothetical protein
MKWFVFVFVVVSNFITRLMHSFLSMKRAVYLLSPPRFLSATHLRVSTAAPSTPRFRLK